MVSKKFRDKYFRIAKFTGEIDNPCYSRQIGVVIVDPRRNIIVGSGYNGPPKGTPHCDSYEFLKNYFWPQLNDEEINLLKKNISIVDANTFAHNYMNCSTCPRKLINAKSGERSELCSCQHAERNAISNSPSDVNGFYMFCWCGVPCIQCAGAIINAGIKKVYCLKTEYYHEASLWLFDKSQTELIEISESDIT